MPIKSVMRISERWALAREALFPYNCAVCGKTLFDAHDVRYGLCSCCARVYRLARVPRCDKCGKPLISEQGRCFRCREDGSFAFDAAMVLYPYTGAYRTLLAAYKFEQHRPLGVFFAEKLLEAACYLPQPAAEAVWMPVPPRPGKIKALGWDQVETLARFLERGAKKLPVRRGLKRLAVKSQKELGKDARRVNLAGNIIVTQSPPERVIIFDDVFTTGATLSACAGALKAAGAKEVWGICLFFN